MGDGLVAARLADDSDFKDAAVGKPYCYRAPYARKRRSMVFRPGAMKDKSKAK